MKTNRLTAALGIEKPVIQGALMWLTNAELVAAVGNAGGMGVLGPNAGQTERTTSPVETAERMRREIRKVRQLSDKPFAVNVLPVEPEKDVFTKPMLKVLYEEKVPAVSYVGDIYPEVFDDLVRHGIKVIYRDLNPNVASAQMAEAHGATAIVATGFDEGGTLPNKVIGTFSIVPMIVDAVKHTPVLAAGGVVDERTARAAKALGAEGVYSGSVFLASQEAPMAENIKNKLVQSSSDDMRLFRTLPAYYRALPGGLSDKLVEMNAAGKAREDIYQAMGGFRGIHAGMLDGDMEKGYVSLDTALSSIHEIRPVADIVAELSAGMLK
ncbi:NAD(P)H-dependent flavin oxidoreductase [Levilactobacillus lanxiensis]|uniref:Probable nitronate monooxygenase n=1 Tax=Levilactobacillus lanxiensis TaxID=2799568 RepID=A0ABW4D9M3_9LACO|nr:nitronate monooxygenase [Levilactobacillus lanxiensis]